MNKYTFSTQSGKAYYCNSIPGFIKDTSASKFKVDIDKRAALKRSIEGDPYLKYIVDAIKYAAGIA